MPFVLDNSVVTGWYLPEQATSYSQTVATRLESDKALVPALWQQELAMRYGLLLATQDAQLKDAAIAAGVAILSPP